MSIGAFTQTAPCEEVHCTATSPQKHSSEPCTRRQQRAPGCSASQRGQLDFLLVRLQLGQRTSSLNSKLNSIILGFTELSRLI